MHGASRSSRSYTVVRHWLHDSLTALNLPEASTLCSSGVSSRAAAQQESHWTLSIERVRRQRIFLPTRKGKVPVLQYVRFKLSHNREPDSINEKKELSWVVTSVRSRCAPSYSELPLTLVSTAWYKWTRCQQMPKLKFCSVDTFLMNDTGANWTLCMPQGPEVSDLWFRDLHLSLLCRYKENRYPENTERLVILNNSGLDAEVQFQFQQDTQATTYMLDPPTMSLKPGQKQVP